MIIHKQLSQSAGALLQSQYSGDNVRGGGNGFVV